MNKHTEKAIRKLAEECTQKMQRYPSHLPKSGCSIYVGYLLKRIAWIWCLHAGINAECQNSIVEKMTKILLDSAEDTLR